MKFFKICARQDDFAFLERGGNTSRRRPHSLAFGSEGDGFGSPQRPAVRRRLNVEGRFSDPVSRRSAGTGPRALAMPSFAAYGIGGGPRNLFGAGGPAVSPPRLGRGMAARSAAVLSPRRDTSDLRIVTGSRLTVSDLRDVACTELAGIIDRPPVLGAGNFCDVYGPFSGGVGGDYVVKILHFRNDSLRDQRLNEGVRVSKKIRFMLRAIELSNFLGKNGFPHTRCLTSRAELVQEKVDDHGEVTLQLAEGAKFLLKFECLPPDMITLDKIEDKAQVDAHLFYALKQIIVSWKSAGKVWGYDFKPDNMYVKRGANPGDANAYGLLDLTDCDDLLNGGDRLEEFVSRLNGEDLKRSDIRLWRRFADDQQAELRRLLDEVKEILRESGRHEDLSQVELFITSFCWD